MALVVLVVFYAYLRLTVALSKEQWRSQSIYQLLTDRYARTDGSTAPCSDLGNYCGGTWQGIINHLDYIQGMGFTAIWISPITEQIQGPTYYGAAYHGFWPQQINQVNSNFGTAADLKALSNALHQRGMYLMVDMVTNDMAWNGGHTSVDYSKFDVFNDPSYYHPFCQVTDYQNATQASQCWTGDEHLELPDLATENTIVLNKWESWVSNITSFYGIDGIRLDACLEQEKSFFPPFESAAGVFVICEVYNYPIDGVCDYQKYVTGLLNFPIWYKVIDAFGSTSGNMANLSSGITQVQGNCTDVSLLGNFVENHDVNRLPHTVTDSGLDQNAIAFTMLNDGIPIIYAGEEQYYNGGSPPADREVTWTSKYDTTNIYYQLIKSINLFRNCVIANDATYVTAKTVPFFLDFQVIGVKKGSSAAKQVVGVYNNRGTGAVAYTINMANTGWTAGQQVYEIYTKQTVTVDPDGTLPVYMFGGQPRIYYLLSSQCSGNGSTKASPTTTSSIPSSTPAGLPSSSPSSTPSSTPAGLPSSSPSSSPALLSSSTLGSTSSSAVASVLPSSSGQISSSGTSTPNIISAIGATPPSTSSLPIAPSGTITSGSISGSPVQSSSSGNPLSTPASVTSVPSATTPGTSSPSSGMLLGSSSVITSGATASNVPASASLLPTVSASTAPTPATTPPVCPSADGGSFTLNGQVFVVGCGIGSDHSYYTQHTGSDIADCVRICVTSVRAPACEAVTYINGVCYLKSGPGAVHNEDGSDTAFVVSTPNGPETIASGFLSGNISHAAPSCPDANGNTFESHGYIYVVGCSTDNFVVDISTSPGTDLASCLESCIKFSGTTSCAAVTYNNGICHLKASVGTVFHAGDVDTAFIIANQAGVNPAGLPPSGPPPGPPSAGSPSLPPHPVGTYTISFDNEVIVYMPDINESCPE